ncbi:phage baseplate assembly protein V [Chelatococcus asaccharovorans]|uniref:Phage baseplate assembly protein V n=1 Tax=Chelatococcus asaccharovorans TaxID=28210 RepID=A0A2V3UB47_9HYPH|nr:phage baseplate assembly protein V [Chelatococcus asaccharovorans]MBS7703316.1 phage baseplate assembly protein V [Chelatococcus asaccharovorans]PXW61649.1 phage baseplate assembly protein V [Chelatococcus asaccharovorans]
MSQLEQAFRILMREVEWLRNELEETNRRHRNLFRPAEVTEAHASEYRVSVTAGGLPSSKVPWVEVAGDNQTWFPPSKKQKGYLVSPSGEPGVGFFLPTSYTDDKKPPFESRGDLFGMKRGSSYITVEDGLITLRADRIRAVMGRWDFEQG